MEFFDWLLGKSQIGVLKFALLSGFFGLILLGTLWGFVYESSGGARGLVVAAGAIPLIAKQSIYWSFRRRQLWRWVDEGNRKAPSAILALSWRRPSLAAEFQPVIDFYTAQVQSARDPN